MYLKKILLIALIFMGGISFITQCMLYNVIVLTDDNMAIIQDAQYFIIHRNVICSRYVGAKKQSSHLATECQSPKYVNHDKGITIAYYNAQQVIIAFEYFENIGTLTEKTLCSHAVKRLPKNDVPDCIIS